MIFALIVGGAITGFLSGFFGIGGGAIAIPLLIAIYKHDGMDPTQAIRLAFGTSLAMMAFTGLSALLAQHRAGNVDSEWFKKLFITSGVGAFIGALLASRIPGTWLNLGLTTVLLYFGVQLILQRSPQISDLPLFKKWHHLAGLLSGATYSLAGMGGASLMIFYLSKVGLPLRMAIGTATSVILPISIGATLGFGIESSWPKEWRWGYIDLYALLIMGLYSVGFTGIGVKCSAFIPTKYLQKVFGLAMILLAIKTFTNLIGR